VTSRLLPALNTPLPKLNTEQVTSDPSGGFRTCMRAAVFAFHT